MLLTYIKNILFGKITILVEGFFIEKYINICMVRRIGLYNIRRENSSIFLADTTIKEFKKLKSVCKKTKCKMKIVKKTGLPFLLHKYRKRKITILMIVLAIAMIVFANSFIFNIQVINSDDLEYNQMLIDKLKEYNVDKFTCKYFIDNDYIKNQMIIGIEDLSWIELNVKGVTLLVDIHRRDLKPNIVDKNVACNIVATKPGVIEKVVVREGFKAVEIGGVVDVGDILISGIIPSTLINDRFVHSDGEVFAKVWYSKKVEIPFYEEKITYTGNEEKKYGINFINKKLFFSKLSTNFKEYDTMLNEKRISVDKYVLPIKYYEVVYTEKNTQIINRTKDEAINYGLDVLQKELKEMIPQDTGILDTRNIITEKLNGVEVELIYECSEQIGTEEKIN